MRKTVADNPEKRGTLSVERKTILVEIDRKVIALTRNVQAAIALTEGVGKAEVHETVSKAGQRCFGERAISHWLC